MRIIFCSVISINLLCENRFHVIDELYLLQNRELTVLEYQDNVKELYIDRCSRLESVKNKNELQDHIKNGNKYEMVEGKLTFTFVIDVIVQQDIKRTIIDKIDHTYGVY